MQDNRYHANLLPDCIIAARGYDSPKGQVRFMQSPGLGNPANALGSLAILYGVAAPLLITTCGTRRGRNIAIGQSTVPSLAPPSTTLLA
jgi:sulfopyruvate decarboxylase TPP-binding subunit